MAAIVRGIAKRVGCTCGQFPKMQVSRLVDEIQQPSREFPQAFSSAHPCGQLRPDVPDVP
jgi:hypothetical protein